MYCRLNCSPFRKELGHVRIFFGRCNFECRNFNVIEMKIKKQLVRCGGTCKENSAVLKLYNPVKLNGHIVFNRASYCTNTGCGWSRKYPGLPFDKDVALNGKSESINFYLRQMQKKFPAISIELYWVTWVWVGHVDFEDYLKELQTRKDGTNAN